VCSAVHQPTAPLCDQKFINYWDEFVTVYYGNIWSCMYTNLQVLMEFLHLNPYAMLLLFVF